MHGRAHREVGLEIQVLDPSLGLQRFRFFWLLGFVSGAGFRVQSFGFDEGSETLSWWFPCSLQGEWTAPKHIPQCQPVRFIDSMP